MREQGINDSIDFEEEKEHIKEWKKKVDDQRQMLEEMHTQLMTSTFQNQSKMRSKGMKN